MSTWHLPSHPSVQQQTLRDPRRQSHLLPCVLVLALIAQVLLRTTDLLRRSEHLSISLCCHPRDRPATFRTTFQPEQPLITVTFLFGARRSPLPVPPLDLHVLLSLS